MKTDNIVLRKRPRGYMAIIGTTTESSEVLVYGEGCVCRIKLPATALMDAEEVEELMDKIIRGRDRTEPPLRDTTLYIDETRAVRQKEQQEKDFFCGKSTFTGKACSSKQECMLNECNSLWKKDS